MVYKFGVEKINERKLIRIPDVILKKLDARAGDLIVFFDNGGHVCLKKGEVN